MLNFKQVLLGEAQNLNLREKSQWPELGSNNHGNLLFTKTERNIETNKVVRSTKAEPNIIPESTSSKSVVSIADFPKLEGNVERQSDKRTKIYTLQPDYEQTTHINDVNLKLEKKGKSLMSKCKRTRKSPFDAPISVDINVMLKIALTSAERKHQLKRMHHNKKRLLPLQEQLFVKGKACGNKLDSDCPIRHKGKKRPHKQRQSSTIKRSFLMAAKKSEAVLTKRKYLTKEMSRLRNSILTGVAKGQDINNLITDIDRLEIKGSQNINDEDERLILLDNIDAVKSVIHTKNFRPYCNHILKGCLKDKSRELITTLRIYQDKAHLRDPLTSKAKRRYVCGCHEARKFLRADSVKLLYIANNIAIDNGMPEILEELFKMSREIELPIVFSANAFDLGFWTLKKRKISVIAVLNYEGAEKLFNELLEELSKAREDYLKIIQKISLHLRQENKDDIYNLKEDELLKEVEQQIRENIILKLT